MLQASNDWLDIEAVGARFLVSGVRPEGLERRHRRRTCRREQWLDLWVERRVGWRIGGDDEWGNPE